MSENSIITLARLWLVTKKTPYLATALWALTPIETPGLGTIGVDQWFRLYWDPEVINKWSVPEVATIIYHEVNHLLREHHDRANLRDPRIFNLATDMEINDDIVEDPDWNFPVAAAKTLNDDGYVLPSTIGAKNGLLAEAYYEMLMKMASPQEKGEGGNESSGAGEGNCGSCSREKQQDNEEGPPNPGESGLSNIEAELIRKQTAEDIQGSNRGNIPGEWSRWAEDKLDTKVNWRSILAKYIKDSIIMASGAVDYTYLKRGRYQLPGNVIYPTLYEPVPKIAIVVDTSGSMSQQHLNQALTEIDKILKTTGAIKGIKIFAVDSRVATVQVVVSTKDIKMKGGGGTDMRVGIEAAAKDEPDMIIVLTDGDTPWPEKPTKPRVIAGLITRYHWIQDSVPAWIKRVQCWDS